MKIELGYRCGLRWDDLPGDARQRQCPTCQTPVVNLAFLTEAEVAALEGEVCVRFARDANGEAIVAAPPHALRRRVPLIGRAVAAVVVGVALAGDARADLSPPSPGQQAEPGPKTKRKRKPERPPAPPPIDHGGEDMGKMLSPKF